MASLISDNARAAAAPCLEIKISKDLTSIPADRSILARLQFGDVHCANEKYLSVQTDLQVLEAGLLAQYWLADGPVQQDQYKGVCYACNQHVLFGHVRVACRDEDSLQRLVEQVYDEIYGCLMHTGCVHLLRTWNYFPRITGFDTGQDESNRYKLFCRGRLQAMQAHAVDDNVYPAATVIGNQGSHLQVYFLASDTAGVAVENPRQTSAYSYPTTDSLSQPLFSRGILKTWDNRTHFYVSGTASIIGHETRHIDDVRAQLNEAINNVEMLVAHANEQCGTHLNAQNNLLYMKVYVRRSEDITCIKQVLAARLPVEVPHVLLLGDMCRDDLLVEVEVSYQA